VQRLAIFPIVLQFRFLLLFPFSRPTGWRVYIHFHFLPLFPNDSQLCSIIFKGTILSVVGRHFRFSQIRFRLNARADPAAAAPADFRLTGWSIRRQDF
jgi:hypothetical protein